MDSRPEAGSEERANGRSRGLIAPRIVSQVQELHENVVVLAQQMGGGFSSRQARRDLREARQSESDLLRVLGFETYEEFERAVHSDAPEGNGAESNGQRDAGERTDHEDDLVIVLDESSNQPAHDLDLVAALERETAVATRRELDSFRIRVGAFEEELAEVRFEMMRMRDALVGMREQLALAESPARREETASERLAARLDATFTDLARSLSETAAELTNLFGQLRDQRAELADAGERARAEAERVLQVAIDDANRARNEAAEQARQIVDDARSEAGALTRDAMVTLEGLRRLHDIAPEDAES